MSPVTVIGVLVSVLVPSPSCPNPLLPQHLMVAFASNAHEWPSPVLIWVAPVMPVTVTGVFEWVMVSLAQTPGKLWPQHLIVVSASSAHE